MMSKRRSPKDDSLIGNIIKHRVRRGPILKIIRDQIFMAATEIYNPTDFESKLMNDIENAERFAMIVSPFLNLKKVKRFVSELESRLSKKSDRESDNKEKLKYRVKIIVVTKDPDELKSIGMGRGKKRVEYHKKCIEVLESAGIDVKTFPKERKLHFKAAIIDGRIIYVGSINYLSITTEEVTPEDYMLRFESEALVAEVVDTVFGWNAYSDWIKP